MAIELEVPVRHREYRGYDEKQYPLGTWFAEGDLTGDASGDPMTIKVLFQDSLQALTSLSYSLEQMWVRRSDTTARVTGVSIINLGSFAFTRQFTLTNTPSSGGGTVNAMGIDQPTQLPIFLGRIFEQAVDASLEWAAPNSGVSVSMRFQVEGYYWGARSITAPGGPQRPPGGMYGHS